MLDYIELEVARNLYINNSIITHIYNLVNGKKKEKIRN